MSEQNNLALIFKNFLKTSYIDKDYIEKIINDNRHDVKEFESKSDKIEEELNSAYKTNLIEERSTHDGNQRNNKS